MHDIELRNCEEIYFYAGQRAARVKKRVGYLLGRRRRVFILHRSHNKLIEPGLKPD